MWYRLLTTLPPFYRQIDANPLMFTGQNAAAVPTSCNTTGTRFDHFVSDGQFRCCRPVAGESTCPVTPPRQTPSPTTLSPTSPPTFAPTRAPTQPPSRVPTRSPTRSPTVPPTFVPTRVPTTSQPTDLPTFLPTAVPTQRPTSLPTRVPSTSAPAPTTPQTSQPSQRPTRVPAVVPTRVLTLPPVVSGSPTEVPTALPTALPADIPTELPTSHPTLLPTTQAPGAGPNAAPTQPPPSTSPSASTTPTTTAPTSLATAASSSGSEGGPTVWIVVGLVLFICVVAAVALLARRTKRNPKPRQGAYRPSESAQPLPEMFTNPIFEKGGKAAPPPAETYEPAVTHNPDYNPSNAPGLADVARNASTSLDAQNYVAPKQTTRSVDNSYAVPSNARQDSRLVANNLYAHPDEGGVAGAYGGSGPSHGATQQLPVCRYANSQGRACRNAAIDPQGYCKNHKCPACGKAKASRDYSCGACEESSL